MRYLVDTSIWIDLYEDRRGYANEPLGEYALKFFFNIISKKEIIIVTDLLLTELESKYSLDQINGMFAPFQTERISSTERERDEAKRIATEMNIPPGDALHAIMARDNTLTLITRDKHFRQLEGISKHYKPENII